MLHLNEKINQERQYLIDLKRNFGVEKQNSWNEKFTRRTQQQIEFAEESVIFPGKSIEIT